MTEKEYKKFEGKYVRIGSKLGIVCGYSSVLGDVSPLLVAYLGEGILGHDRQFVPICMIFTSHENNRQGYVDITVNDFYKYLVTTTGVNNPSNVGDTINAEDYAAGISKTVMPAPENSVSEEAKTPNHFFIDCQVYPFNVLISCGESDEELTKVLIDEGGVLESEVTELLKDLSFSGRAITHMRENGPTIIRFRTPGDACIFMGTVAHECMHAAFMILDRCGLKHEFDTSDEAYTYLTGYLTTNVVEGLMELGKLSVTV